MVNLAIEESEEEAKDERIMSANDSLRMSDNPLSELGVEVNK